MVTYLTETRSSAETFALGQRLGQQAAAGQVIALHGDLGAGKTVLTQGIAAGLGIKARVTSPTFTLVSEYPYAKNQYLIHIDCYRLGSLTQTDGALEAAFFGLEEILDRADAIVIIEWAERVATLLPADHLQISLTYTHSAPANRQIEFVAYGPVSATMLQQFQVGQGSSL